MPAHVFAIFSDVFLLLTFLFVGLAVLSLVVKRSVQAPPADAH